MTGPIDDNWIALTDEEIPFADIMSWAVQDETGALVTFSGTVRDHSDGRPGVRELEYEAFPEHVESQLFAVADEARRLWPMISRIALIHRIGRLQLGEVSVLVAVSTPHRPEAFEAALFSIDTLKAAVPIWKRETWDGGSDWSQCDHAIVAPADLAHLETRDGASGSEPQTLPGQRGLGASRE